MLLYCNGKKGFCHETTCDGKCQFYDGSGVKRIKTRADTIRSMTDEELVKFLYSSADGYCKNLSKCAEQLDSDAEIPDDDWCEKCLLEWLREPVGGTKPATMTEEDKLHSGLVEED